MTKCRKDCKHTYEPKEKPKEPQTKGEKWVDEIRTSGWCPVGRCRVDGHQLCRGISCSECRPLLAKALDLHRASDKPDEPPEESEFRKAARKYLHDNWASLNPTSTDGNIELLDKNSDWHKVMRVFPNTIKELRTFWNTALGLAEGLAIKRGCRYLAEEITDFKAPEKG